MIDEARNSGLDVTADQYPYAASSTGLNVIFPAWSLEGGDAETNERLKDPEARARIKAGIMDNINFDRGGGDPARIVVSSYPADLSIEGKNISEILQMRGLEPGVNSAAEVLMELQSTQPGGTGIYHAMSEADVSTFMRHPGISIATDAHIVKFGEAMPHPRNYGTNPRVLGNYVREKNVLTLENAIQKMTSLPAARLKLKARGVLKKDMIADIVIFDPDTVVDHAIWAQPHQYPEGIPYVFINGEAVIKNGDRTQSFPGKMLRGPAFVH
jgi:dihydroorotase/N-acyl-D-amino-acid deacylase